MELYIPHTLILKLKNPGLTLLVLVLSKIERWFTKGTVAIHMLKFMPYIFMLVIMPNLFSNFLKVLSSIENVIMFPILPLLVISGI